MNNTTRTKAQMTSEDRLLRRMAEDAATSRKEERAVIGTHLLEKRTKDAAMDRAAADNAACEDRLWERMTEDAAADRAEKYLLRVRRLHQRIEQKIRLKDQLRDLANRATGEWLPQPGGGRVDSRSAAVERMVDLEKEINDDIDHLWNLKNEVWRVLDRIENQDMANVLDDFYLLGCNAEQAAKRSGFCKRYTNKLKRWGLLEVDRILREEQPMQGYVSPLE